MNLEERVYSVLVVSAAEKVNKALCSILTLAHCSPIRVVTSVSAAKRAWNERSFDFVIINAPLPDDVGADLAVDIGASQSAVVLLLLPSEIYTIVREKTAGEGVFTLGKPVSHAAFSTALDWMVCIREKLGKLEKKTLSIEEKMEEIRLVNRAKWLLISKLQMDENQAHRYLEKQAMDRCIPRRDVAKEIIKTYS